MIEPAITAQPRWVRSIASSLLAAVLTVCGIFTASALAASPGLPIIVYHQIRNTPDGPPDSLEAISLDRFKSEMRYLHEHGYQTLSAQEAVNYLHGGDQPGKKVVAIQFDDGWKSGQLALPVLDKYGFKATFWIIAGKGIGWPHLDWDEIETIARNPRYDIYSHTMTHPWKPGDTMLDWMSWRTPGKGPDQVRWELAESRRVLAEKLGRPVPYLAWPGGHYNDAMIQLAKESGYVALFTIDNGVNYPGDNPLRIRRTMVHGGCDDQVFAQILRDGIYQDCKAAVAAFPK
jgi:peptidoglycan/xylan/chitin deacetylase (PgdA/CDA1 family)